MFLVKHTLKYLGLACCLSSASVHAGLIEMVSEVQTFDLWAGAVDTNPTRGTNDTGADQAQLYFDGFDHNLGSLVGVDIYFESDWYLRNQVFSVDYQYPGDYPSAAARGQGGMRLSADIFDPTGADDVQLQRSLHSRCWDRDYHYAADCSDVDTRTNPFDANFDLTDIDLSAFVGGDDAVGLQFDLDIWADLKGCGKGDNYCFDYASGDWGGAAYVTYTYEDVPVSEPYSLVLLGIGLLGLGVARRRAAVA